MKRKNSLKNSRKRIIQATVAAVAGGCCIPAGRDFSKRSTAGGGKHRCTEDGNRR